MKIVIYTKWLEMKYIMFIEISDIEKQIPLVGPHRWEQLGKTDPSKH